MQVGACIVNQENKIVGIGYNGMPNGCDDDLLPWSRSADDRLDTKYPYGKLVIHLRCFLLCIHLRKQISSCSGLCSTFRSSFLSGMLKVMLKILSFCLLLSINIITNIYNLQNCFPLQGQLQYLHNRFVWRTVRCEALRGHVFVFPTEIPIWL